MRHFKRTTLSLAAVQAMVWAASPAMAQTAPGTEVHQALDVHRHFAAQIALCREFADLLAQFLHVRVGQILDLRVCFNACSSTDQARAAAADAIDRGQRDFSVLMIWNVYPTDTGHILSTPLR
mgnify:CR=1 FL=1